NAAGPILECGCGLSTLLLGLVAQPRNISVWSLEHHPDWAGRVRQALDAHHIRSVRLCVNDLRDYGTFTLDQPPEEGLPSAFALVVCDGPPGATAGGRYGLLPVMRACLGSGCTILLDDLDRDAERTLLERWSAETGGRFSVEGTRHRFGVLTLPT